MRLIPEKAVGIGLARQRHAEVPEVVAVAVRVETCIREFLAGECGNLTVFDIVLQKFADLFSAEVFAVAPRVDQDAQPHLVRLRHDFRNIRAPEVEIEFRDRQNDGGASVVKHFLKIFFRVLHIVEPVITDCRLCDCHFRFPFFIISYTIVLNISCAAARRPLHDSMESPKRFVRRMRKRCFAGSIQTACPVQPVWWIVDAEQPSGMKSGAMFQPMERGVMPGGA